MRNKYKAYTITEKGKKTKQRHSCQSYGGQVIRSYDDISCLQCGAPHTGEGELVSTCSAQEFEALLAVREMILLKGEIAPKFLFLIT